MNLSPEIIDAMRGEFDAMGVEFYPEGLVKFKADTPDTIELAMSMGLPAQEMARLLIQKFLAADIEHQLPKCIREIDSDIAYVSMPLDDLRFAYGYIALVEAGAKITSEQTKRAIQIVHKLTATSHKQEN